MNIVPIEKNLKEEHKNVISIFHDTLEYYKKFVSEVLNSPKYDDEYKLDLLFSSGIGRVVNISKDKSKELGAAIFDEKKITILDNVTKIGFYNISDSDSIFKSHDKDLTVYCYKDSMAANYAIKYNIKYVYLTKPAIDNNEENKEDKKQNVTEPAIDAKQEDTTIATGKLPQAGSSSVIIIIIIAVMVILIINYKRYNSYKDIK